MSCNNFFFSSSFRDDFSLSSNGGCTNFGHYGIRCWSSFLNDEATFIDHSFSPTKKFFYSRLTWIFFSSHYQRKMSLHWLPNCPSPMASLSFFLSKVLHYWPKSAHREYQMAIGYLKPIQNCSTFTLSCISKRCVVKQKLEKDFSPASSNKKDFLLFFFFPSFWGWKNLSGIPWENEKTDSTMRRCWSQTHGKLRRWTRVMSRKSRNSLKIHI